MQKFLYGLKDVGSNFDFYAFSDQDDIWEKNKLENSIKKIEALNYLINFILFKNSLF